MPKTEKTTSSQFFTIHSVAKSQKMKGDPLESHSAKKVKGGTLLLWNACKKLVQTNRFEHERRVVARKKSTRTFP